MDTVFRSATVERKAVIAAMRQFDREDPEPNDYAGWLEKDTYKYAVEFRGRLPDAPWESGGLGLEDLRSRLLAMS